MSGSSATMDDQIIQIEHAEDSYVDASPSPSAEDEEKSRSKLFKLVMEGNWDEVIRIFENDPEAIYEKITRSEETALHIAISDDRLDVVKKILEMTHKVMRIKQMKNKKGNNPLHRAAQLDKAEICNVLVKKDSSLIGERNEDGETPLFLAALHGNMRAFDALHFKCACSRYIRHPIYCCRRNSDGNNILHVCILGEHFEMAFCIMKWYSELHILMNDKGQTALQFLANNPFAFRSGCHLGLVNGFIYESLEIPQLKFRLPSEIKDAKTAESCSYPDNCSTLFVLYEVLKSAAFEVLLGWKKTPYLGKGAVEGNKQAKKDEQKSEQTSSNDKSAQACGSEGHIKRGKNEDENGSRHPLPFPRNYITFFRMLNILLELFLFVLGLGFFNFKKVREKKDKHMMAFQVMKELVAEEKSWMYEESGSKPLDRSGGFETVPNSSPNVDDDSPASSNTLREDTNSTSPKKNGDEVKSDTQKKSEEERSPLLLAAKMGVVELVDEILKKFPIAVEDENKQKKNVVLLAAEHRQPRIYELLSKKFKKMENVFRKVDADGNSVLHLAATFAEYRPWKISGSALQTQWEIKWYQYIEQSVPSNFFARINTHNQTAEEIFISKHENLVKDGGSWLNSTSQSCSVVAALVATVAFASATTVPGGLNENGTPMLGHHIGFNIFSIGSLVALGFSITSLTMFLSILTSRFQVRDFRYRLPTKLIVGLFSLFVAIASMLISFCAGHYFVLQPQLKNVVFFVYGITCIPVSLFAIAQFPLYWDLLRTVMARIPVRNFEVISL